MSATGAGPEILRRSEAIAQLREELRRLTDDEHSICQIAAEKRIFCHGFRRWPDSEFDRRWRVALGRSTHLSRAQMEQLANLWQLAEQVRCRVALACDAQADSRSACRGWDEFSNDELARHCCDLLARNVEVIP